jgi:hypothetical protein
VSCFNHIKIVPKPAMSIWVQCYITPRMAYPMPSS